MHPDEFFQRIGKPLSKMLVLGEWLGPSLTEQYQTGQITGKEYAEQRTWLLRCLPLLPHLAKVSPAAAMILYTEANGPMHELTETEFKRARDWCLAEGLLYEREPEPIDEEDLHVWVN